jgi:hypothetical protein
MMFTNFFMYHQHTKYLCKIFWTFCFFMVLQWTNSLGGMESKKERWFWMFICSKGNCMFKQAFWSIINYNISSFLWKKKKWHISVNMLTGSYIHVFNRITQYRKMIRIHMYSFFSLFSFHTTIFEIFLHKKSKQTKS